MRAVRAEIRIPTLSLLLSQYHWSLEVVSTERVKLNLDIMNHVDEKSGYKFVEALAKRSGSLQRTNEEYASEVWPVILRKEDYLLLDGYCRFTTLKNMRIPKICAYVGER